MKSLKHILQVISSRVSEAGNKTDVRGVHETTFLQNRKKIIVCLRKELKVYIDLNNKYLV